MRFFHKDAIFPGLQHQAVACNEAVATPRSFSPELSPAGRCMAWASALWRLGGSNMVQPSKMEISWYYWYPMKNGDIYCEYVVNILLYNDG